MNPHMTSTAEHLKVFHIKKKLAVSIRLFDMVNNKISIGTSVPTELALSVGTT